MDVVVVELHAFGSQAIECGSEERNVGGVEPVRVEVGGGGGVLLVANVVVPVVVGNTKFTVHTKQWNGETKNKH